MFTLECNNCDSTVDFVNRRRTEIAVTSIYINPHTGKPVESGFYEVESTKDVEYECPKCHAIFSSRDEFVKIVEKD